MVAGPFTSATTTRFDEVNRALSGFSIHKAFCAPVRPRASRARSSSPQAVPDVRETIKLVIKTYDITQLVIIYLHISLRGSSLETQSTKYKFHTFNFLVLSFEFLDARYELRYTNHGSNPPVSAHNNWGTGVLSEQPLLESPPFWP
jgi:hypothetical protein